MPLLILLLVPFAKIVATSLSIGSGGSGGIFGPGMVIGATLGAALWRLLHEIAPGSTFADTVGASPGIWWRPAWRCRTTWA